MLPQSRLARLGLFVVGGLLTLAALMVLAWWTWSRWTEGEVQRANAIAAEETAKGLSGAAGDALETVNETHREVIRIEQITRRNQDAILASTDAGLRAPGVAAALHDGLCRRAAYEREPDCAALLGNGGGIGPAGTDAGSGEAGE